MTHPDVTIHATDDSVTVTVKVDGKTEETLEYSLPGMLSGCDLRDVLAACGIHADYTYDEGDNDDEEV